MESQSNGIDLTKSKCEYSTFEEETYGTFYSMMQTWLKLKLANINKTEEDRFPPKYSTCKRNYNIIMNIADIINQNDQSIFLLANNDFAGAIQSSSVALRLQKDLYEEAGNFLEQGTFAVGLDQCMMLSDTGDHNQLPSAIQGMIYHLGIPVPPNETRPFRMSQILIFNAALAHHLSAETSANRETMNKAKLLYQMVCNPGDMAESPLFQFAVINNLGVIERRMGNVSNQYFDMLPSLLNHLEA